MLPGKALGTTWCLVLIGGCCDGPGMVMGSSREGCTLSYDLAAEVDFGEQSGISFLINR